MCLVKLRHGHLFIDSGMAAEFFAGAAHADIIYYPDTGTLLLASTKDALFKSLHKTKSYLIKEKNVNGDKAISLEAIMIDNDIDTTDRDLRYEADKDMKIISIYF